MAAKKRPTNEEVKGLLLEGNFGSSDDEPLPLSDPLSTTQLLLKLADIKPYDKNPRRERNPAYDEIKASIRSKKQLNNNFNVTRRPGDDKYMIESGGNTRLQILHELYMETADEAFNNVHCLFVPWTSESSILTAHLIENEMRGEMMLIDKAYAVKELKQEIEREKGINLSDRAFITLASAAGYKVSRTYLIRFNYALKLDQMIPSTLRSGIGGTRLDFIKKTEKAYLQLCEDNAEQFDAVFMDVMSENDAEEHFDFDQVRNDLDFRLEPMIGIRHNLIYMKVNQIMENNPGNRDDINDIDFSETNHTEITQGSDDQPSQSAGLTEETGVITDALETEQLDRETALDADGEGLIQSAVNETQATQDKSPTQVQPSPAVILKRLQERNYALAIKIAGRELEDSVVALKGGLGFVMDTPPISLLDGTQTPVEINVHYYRWWTLFSLSEQAMKNEHFEIWSYLDIYNRLGKQQHQVEDENDLLVMRIGEEISVNSIVHGAINNTAIFNDKTFTNIFRLMENTRKIRHSYTEEQLWQVSK